MTKPPGLSAGISKKRLSKMIGSRNRFSGVVALLVELSTVQYLGHSFGEHLVRSSSGSAVVMAVGGSVVMAVGGSVVMAVGGSVVMAVGGSTVVDCRLIIARGSTSFGTVGIESPS